LCLDDPQQIRLLLIGGSGVGKSTWINAFANYCSFESLDAAERFEGWFPIPSTFELTDPQTGKMISISSECSGLTPISDVAEVGESATQNPNEYVFQYGNTQIILIDTPGLLDTKDAGTSEHDKDKDHVSNILRSLSAYEKIHAICIVLKANETRLNDTFKYTLSEILKRLDKNAINNVIFIFSNSASTNFKISKTQAILQTFLSESNLQIPLPPEKPTIYCFENDTVQYLAERKNNITPGEDDKENATKSWRKSAESTAQMIHYVCSLDALSLDGIKAIYNAECTISILSDLVLDTLMCIFRDTKKLEQKKTEADKLKTAILKNPNEFAQYDLRRLLHVTESKVVRVPLGHTNIVCEGPKCARYVNGEIVYPQICVEACNDRWMYFSKHMTGWFWVKCSHCGCNKGEHEWRTTKTEIVTETKQDDSVVAKIVDSNSALEKISETIEECEDRVSMWQDEAEQMLNICAQLNNFVLRNTLMERFGADSLTKILQTKIGTYARLRKYSEVKELRRITNQYNAFLAENRHCKPNDVHKLIQQLYRLPMKGKDLRRAVEQEEKARSSAVVGTKSNQVLYLPEFACKVLSKFKPISS